MNAIKANTHPNIKFFLFFFYIVYLRLFFRPVHLAGSVLFHKIHFGKFPMLFVALLNGI